MLTFHYAAAIFFRFICHFVGWHWCVFGLVRFRHNEHSVRVAAPKHQASGRPSTNHKAIGMWLWPSLSRYIPHDCSPAHSLSPLAVKTQRSCKPPWMLAPEVQLRLPLFLPYLLPLLLLSVHLFGKKKEKKHVFLLSSFLSPIRHTLLTTPLDLKKHVFKHLSPLSHLPCQSISVSTLHTSSPSFHFIHPSVERDWRARSIVEWGKLAGMEGICDERDWEVRRGQNGGHLEYKERDSLCFPPPHFYSFFLHLAIDFSPSCIVYLSHSSVCLPMFPRSTDSTHSFII